MGSRGGGEAAIVYDAATVAYISALAAASLPTPTNIADIDTLIRKLKSDGLWDKMDCIYSLANKDKNSNVSLYNIKNPLHATIGVASPTNNIVFDNVNGFGWTAGSTQFINTNFNPNTFAGAKYTRYSAHASIYIRTTPVVNNLGIILGHNSSPYLLIAPRMGSGKAGAIINSNIAWTESPYAIGLGMIAVDRSANARIDMYKNGASVANNKTTTAGVINASICLCGVVTPGWSCEAMCSFATIGASLSSAEHEKAYAAVQTYLGTVGASV